MPTAIRTSRTAVLTLVLGVLSLACGFLALVSQSDLFLLGVILGWVAALALGVRSWVAVGRAPGRLRGKALAGWGMGVPTAGFVLGFLLLPAT